MYADANCSGPPLRVVLAAPPAVPKWLEAFVAACRSGGAVDLRVVALAPDSTGAGRRSRAPLDLRLSLGLERMLWVTLGRLAGGRSPDPLAIVGIEASGGGAGRPGGEDVLLAELRACSPDLVILHGSADLAAAAAPLAVHGCWVLDGDLTDRARAGLSLLGPILDGDATTGLSLHLVPGREEGAASDVLSSSHGATGAMSFSQQRNNAFAKLPALLLRALRGLRETQPPAQAVVRTLRVSPPCFQPPAGMGLRYARVAARQLLQWRGRRARARAPWFLLLPPAGATLDPSAPQYEGCACLVAPGEDYWADPYPVVHGGRRLVFVEELVHAKGKGIVVCLELRDGVVERRGVALEEDVHLSFPQVFEWDDAWYMTVESCEAGRVSLYVAEEFPLRWRRVSNLIEGREAVDPTLYHEDGRWYLFTNISESGGALSDELFLFTSTELAGPYRPHPGNPIRTDTRMSRPAGRLFRHEGRLVRPAQCCVPIYGTSIVFNEVLELSPSRYRERPMATLEVGSVPGVDGCHTYNAWGGFGMLDAHGWPPGPDSRIRLATKP